MQTNPAVEQNNTWIRGQTQTIEDRRFFPPLYF